MGQMLTKDKAKLFFLEFTSKVFLWKFNPPEHSGKVWCYEDSLLVEKYRLREHFNYWEPQANGRYW